MPRVGDVERDGTQSLRTIAQKVCTLVSTFGPLIERQWSTEPGVMAALTWARAACTIVPGLDEAFLAIPSGDPVPEDGALWPGVNPAKPAAPEPLPDP